MQILKSPMDGSSGDSSLVYELSPSHFLRPGYPQTVHALIAGAARALSVTAIENRCKPVWNECSADEAARMRSSFDELERRAGELTETGLHGGSYFVPGEKNGAQVIKRVVWAGGCQRYLLGIGNDPRLTAPCAQLLQSNAMDHLLNQAHFKRPGDGVIFDWHQDIQHRDKGKGSWTDVNGRGSVVQTVIVLDEMTPESGPMLFMPGSSKWGRVDFGEHDYDQPYQARKWPEQFRMENAVAIAAQPGDTRFVGPYTVHASFENTSER